MKNFYRNNKPILPPDPQWRQFRVKMDKNHWVKIRRKIQTPEDLQERLIELNPKDVYFMTSKFLDPVNVGSKNLGTAGYKWLYNLFLGSGLYFDMDYKDENVVEDLVSRLKKDGFGSIRVIETGNGYHIWMTEDLKNHFSELKGIKNPKERERAYMSVKKKLVDKYKKDFDFDEPITLDTRRILRVPNTIHSGTGDIVKLIKKN